jgi:GNAT superfamily N-acetyltransferase
LAIAPDGGVAGFSMGAALEGFAAVDGCSADATFGDGSSLYSLEMLVASGHRGRGVGRALKAAQYDAARAAGKRFICGRNKVGGTTEMGPLNASMGAYVVTRLGAQYGEPDGETDYYRINLFPGAVTVPSIVDADGVTDLAHGVQRPLGRSPRSLANAAWRGSLGGPLATKLSLCNFATPDTVRFAELLQRLAPEGCDHVLYCSGRDEMVDKGLRALKYNNRSAQCVLSLEGTYVGHTTAAARSVSDRDDGYFEWPKLPHPAEVGPDAALDALDAALTEHGAANVLGLVLEAFGERSGLAIPDAYYEGLEERRAEGLKVMLVETATGGFRNGRGTCFLADTLPLNPDQVWYYPGGQLGLVFCADSAWVPKPLQLISTWDGDELSMIRVAHHLRWAWRNRDAIGAKAGLFARILSGVSQASALGLAGFVGSEAAPALAERLATSGVLVKTYECGLGLMPALSIDAVAFGAALNRIREAGAEA